MLEIKYIQSLHRPYNQNLNTVKWVCEFVKSQKQIKKSEFYFQFYIYIIKKLSNYYKNGSENSTGLPRPENIELVNSFLLENKNEDLNTLINKKLKKRISKLDKAIFSTYKAASYFINLAKDKLNFIDKDYKLTNTGINLLAIKKRNFELTKNEKIFFFNEILDIDFHFFMSNCYFEIAAKKYHLDDLNQEKYRFLDTYYNIRHFKYTTASLENFNTVRDEWIKDLNIISKSNKIRTQYLSILKSKYNILNEELLKNFNSFEQNNLVKKKNYVKSKEKFIYAFEEVHKNDLGFVNLYNLSSYLKMGYDRFQLFLSEFYENERSDYNIFFNNIAISIDKRKRFYVRNKPVLSIKIKKNAN